LFSYYGTKRRLAKFYPPPKYDRIIEPFCGAAQYSLYGDNWKKEVILFDAYKVITDLWLYLIQASKKDILSLPDVNIGDNLNDFKQLSDVEKSLIGFSINTASAMPKKTVMKRSIWNKDKIRIAENIYKVKHWTIGQRDWRDLAKINWGNVKATWYIDPPYQFGGKYYRLNNSLINYFDLSEWCKSRDGQVIVCENTKATWMDFKPLVELNGQLHKTTEAIWTKES
jgi:site-specific DNA-adenine methylase